MESTIGEIRDLYALLSLSNPDLIHLYKSRIAKHSIVAAKLVASNPKYQATTIITTVDNRGYEFTLDLYSRTYRSKGNWIWATHIEVNYPYETLLSIQISPRVIDLPYTECKICAHWLFRNFEKELNEALNNRLV
ncbi:MAG: hypothetical protein AB8B89_08620 [Gammaproteobacteria bacterium]